jgi:hypothetical protein
LPAAFADRLKGNTLEEMEADAKLLLAAIPAPVKPVPPAVGATSPGAPLTGETEKDKRKRLLT